MTHPLSDADLSSFKRDGFLAPLPGLSTKQTADIKAAVLDHLHGDPRCERYELTDKVSIRRKAGGEDETPEYEYFQEEEPDAAKPVFPFLFNIWRNDARFFELGVQGPFGHIAKQLLGADEVLFFEDNVVVKEPGAKFLPWHQDYSYWPFGEPNCVTFWIALDDIDATNGAMQVAPGSQNLGERLPVQFGSEQVFMDGARPDLLAVPQDPAALGHPIVTYALKAGQCGVHDSLVWHGSTPNQTSDRRLALVLRFVAANTLWLGDQRMPYADIGLAPGGRVTAAHFPAAG